MASQWPKNCEAITSKDDNDDIHGRSCKKFLMLQLVLRNNIAKRDTSIVKVDTHEATRKRALNQGVQKHKQTLDGYKELAPGRCACNLKSAIFKLITRHQAITWTNVNHLYDAIWRHELIFDKKYLKFSNSLKIL